MYNLKLSFTQNLIEAGVDEVGVGSLAGPIVAAAVIMQRGFKNTEITDSKQLSKVKRLKCANLIKKNTLSFGYGVTSNIEVDKLNCKQASFLAMHRALNNLTINPELILVDGHIYRPKDFTPYRCIVKGDTKYLSIASASILAKVYRDDIMQDLDKQYPQYNWKENVGYGTRAHIRAIKQSGITRYHRKTYKICK